MKKLILVLVLIGIALFLLAPTEICFTDHIAQRSHCMSKWNPDTWIHFVGSKLMC